MEDDSLIKLEKIKSIEGYKNHLICCSLFKMKNSYNDFSTYTEGLKDLMTFLENSNKDFIFRIYFDESIDDEKSWKNTMKEIEKKDYTELVKYECKKLKDGKFHDGVFGTLIRFLPIFDNEKEKNWKIYTSTDIDFQPCLFGEFFEIIEKFEDSNAKFLIKEPKCYHLKPFLIDSGMVSKYSLAILAGAFSSKITFNKNLLLNFLLDMMKKGKVYKSFRKSYKSLGLQKSANLEKDLFLYGTDEFFLAEVLLKNLKKRKISILKYNWYISYASLLVDIRKSNNNFKNLTNEEEKRWKQLLKKVIYYKDDKNLKQNYIFLEIHSQCHISKLNKKLCMQFGKEVRKIFYKNQQHLYKIPDSFEECFKHSDYRSYEIIKL